jgi:CDP-glycerol glycerophosphotransferase (TagB/SpsB family)
MNYSSLSYLHEIISGIISRKVVQMLYHPHPAMGMRVKEYKQVSDGISAKVFNGPVSMSKVEIFNKSDAALCDVSGVTSEYLFSCKPIIFPCTEKTINDIELNANFRSICYFWDFEKLHLEDFLRSIASDPLFEARLSFRNSKFHNVKTFQECVDRFDDALDQVCRS